MLEDNIAAENEISHERYQRGNLYNASTIISIIIGLTSSFNIDIVGQLPAGEPLLAVVCFFRFFCIKETKIPYFFLIHRELRFIIISLFLMFFSYVFSDLYLHSETTDFIRGWARIVFLAIDVGGVIILVSWNSSVTWILPLAIMGGEGVQALATGALFDDYWKFGFASVSCSSILLLGSLFGIGISTFTGFGLILLNWFLDFRSFSVIFAIVGTFLFVKMIKKDYRIITMVFGAVICSTVFYYGIKKSGEEGRSGRSNIERSAMIQAAYEGFLHSPLVGNGSWLHRGPVIENFETIRKMKSMEAGGLGQFADIGAEKEVTIHSQILTAAAEAGIFATGFFLVYGILLLIALFQLIMTEKYNFTDAFYLFLLCNGIFNLILNPFSGLHRIYIASFLSVALYIINLNRVNNINNSS